MRTTLTIDDDVLAAARQRADADGTSLGQALSAIARDALTTSQHQARTRNGITLLPTSASATRSTLEEVNALRDEIT